MESKPLFRGRIKLIAICGLAGSGKSALANALTRRYNYRLESFAAPIYEMLNTLPFLEDIHGNMQRSHKEEEIPFYGKSPRQLLQTLGTEWGRDLVNENVWVKILEEKILRRWSVGTRNFVISDLRFPNEALWVRAVGGRIVRMVRPDTVRTTTHISEAGFPITEEDWTCINDGTLNDLYEKAIFINGLAEVSRDAASR